MPDWLVERGIGETRCVRVVDGAIVEARILLDGQFRAGSVIEARLLSKGISGRNAVARGADGRDYLLPKGATGMTEGAAARLEVTREAIPGAEPWKRPLARLTDKPLGEAIIAGEALPFPAPADRLAALGWDDLIDEARTGSVRFAGGELSIEATRAMTLIDVDGSGEPHELAQLGAAAAARAIARLDLQGSIGIDLPTSAGRDARLAAAAALDALVPQPFERTAVNGFGFVQLVRPRARASLIELARDRANFEARALLRWSASATGSTTLSAHPKVIEAIEAQPAWIEALARQVGGAVALRAEAALGIAGGHVH
ncbi:MAG: ribonuclease [Sphingomicrobium sp.]